ncbi:MAG TPA: cupin domain-containing protein [Mycobacteriales bacterium]|nr:cupin domain-containing protein [Mycobacteriales bacterium]
MSAVQSPVTITATDGPGQPPRSAALAELYREFEKELLVPLWTEIGDLMPDAPRSAALPHCWRWTDLLRLAQRAGDLVPVGRGGERRAIALANPGLAGRPFATPTLWAAIQYLNPHEDAPVHRHTQNAFRFVVAGEGVWTVVDGDPVAMRRGDFLPQAGWNWHGHHNISAQPMAWIDGLDIPFQHYLDTAFFQLGPDAVENAGVPDRSRSERLWGHPGLRPLTHLTPTRATPLLAYRWEHTDHALAEQLALEAEGHPVTVEPGHAAVRYTNPTTGGDVLPTIRSEFHRLAPGAETAGRREVGSSVFQVFQGAGEVTAGDATWAVEPGDLFVVPSWQRLCLRTAAGLDLFRFSDTPVLERLGQDRVEVEPGEPA